MPCLASQRVHWRRLLSPPSPRASPVAAAPSSHLLHLSRHLRCGTRAHDHLPSPRSICFPPPIPPCPPLTRARSWSVGSMPMRPSCTSTQKVMRCRAELQTWRRSLPFWHIGCRRPRLAGLLRPQPRRLAKHTRRRRRHRHRTSRRHRTHRRHHHRRRCNLHRRHTLPCHPPPRRAVAAAPWGWHRAVRRRRRH